MLSKRLEQVASMVTKGNIIADIGTDHGYVPIYLVEKGICPKAYAMDINQGPIESAIKNIENYGLSEKIQAIKSNGLEKLEPEKADTIIIAGMGGELIVNILENGLAKLEIALAKGIFVFFLCHRSFQIIVHFISPRKLRCGSLLRNGKSIDFCDFISKPFCDPCDVGTGRLATVDFVLQIFFLRVRNAVLERTVKIMICSVVMNGVGSQITVLIHIPLGIVGIRKQTVFDVAGINHLITASTTVPKSQITDNDNRLRKPHIEI